VWLSVFHGLLEAEETDWTLIADFNGFIYGQRIKEDFWVNPGCRTFGDDVAVLVMSFELEIHH
jgi:hypothetical protein